ncbi:hypothetical protein DAI22_06g129000 [Oryza sativa Japonica Group]|uniref:Uncharacterized protein n=1 Tax=Oryza sativa subsp. japonica TaxID=39947 RepID=Q5Z4N2_ORYSJ|nr:hypothetical protein DAI22_06g129000 [Oryza sativa Japonica Group]BAD62300.1 hypothetical protein [Oryza sativa Japonica Group]
MLSTPRLLPAPRAGDAIPAPAPSAAALRTRAARRPPNAVRQRCPPRALSAAALPAPPRWLSLAASRRCRILSGHRRYIIVWSPSSRFALVSAPHLTVDPTQSGHRRSLAVRSPSTRISLAPAPDLLLSGRRRSLDVWCPLRRQRDSLLPPSQTHLDHISLAAPV